MWSEIVQGMWFLIYGWAIGHTYMRFKVEYDDLEVLSE